MGLSGPHPMWFHHNMFVIKEQRTQHHHLNSFTPVLLQNCTLPRTVDGSSAEARWEESLSWEGGSSVRTGLKKQRKRGLLRDMPCSRSQCGFTIFVINSWLYPWKYNTKIEALHIYWNLLKFSILKLVEKWQSPWDKISDNSH